MEHKKLIYLQPYQKEGLDKLQSEISKKGSQVSMMRLISDAVDIYLEYYKEEAVDVYTRTYRERIKLNGEKT